MLKDLMDAITRYNNVPIDNGIDLNELRKTAMGDFDKDRRTLAKLRYISPSSYAKSFCLRRIVLAWLENSDTVLEDRKPLAFSQQMGYDSGTAQHMIQEKYWSSASMKRTKIIGDWKCSVCGDIVTGKKPASTCSNKVDIIKPDGTVEKKSCKDGHWRYIEYRVKDDELYIKGTIDLCVLKSTYKENILYVYDHKNLPEPIYSRIVEGSSPMPYKFISQIQLYAIVLTRMYPNYVIRPILELRNAQKPHKTTQVPVSNPPHNFIELLVDRAAMIDYCRLNNVIPIRKCECKKDAKHCLLKGVCFDRGEGVYLQRDQI